MTGILPCVFATDIDVFPTSIALLDTAMAWLEELQEDRVLYYSAGEEPPLSTTTPLSNHPATKAKAKANPQKKVTTAALSEQLAALAQATPAISLQFQALQNNQACFETFMNFGGPPPKKPPYQQDFSMPKQMQHIPQGDMGRLEPFRHRKSPCPTRGRTLWTARRGDSSPRPFRSGCSLPLGLTKGPDDLGGTHCLSGRSSRPRKFINELILERVCRKGKDAGGSGRETRRFLIEGGPELPQIQAFRASASQCLPAFKPFRTNPSAQNFSKAKEVSEEDREIGGGQRDLDLGIWMLAHIGDLMVARNSKGTEEMLALTMGSIEQTAQDGGKWEVE